jgi:ABC-2 type transport system ATP-binding protein
MLAGILYPTSGEAAVLGYTPWNRQSAFQKQFSIVMGQKSQLWWDLPAMETFLLNKEIYEVPGDQFTQTLDKLVGMLNVKDLLHIPVRKLSLGQRMRCELIAALIHRPKVLFLDEPTIGLDIISQESVRQFIATYNKRNATTILLTSHYMQDVERLCKRVIVINHGTIVYDGDLRYLKERYADYKIIALTFTAEVQQSDIAAYGQVIAQTSRSAELRIPKIGMKDAVARLIEKLPVDDLTISDVDIEEVIADVFKKRAE